MSLRGWKKIPIKEVYTGFWDGPHATPKPADEGPIFLGIRNITEDGHLDFSDIRHISEMEFPKWIRRVEPKPGDIVFTYEATLHRYAIIPPGFRGCLGRRIALIRTNANIADTKYLFYYFFGKEWRDTVSSYLISGSTVDRIPLIEFPEFPIRLPPLPIQHKIASILSSYDDLIENNARRINILEEIAQTIYREWFVHLRFPGHENARLVDSGTELGMVPEEWNVLPFSEACLSIEDGDWIESKDQGGSDYRLIQISNIGCGEFKETGNVRYITQETFRRLKCKEIKIGDILVARMPDPIGRAWLIPKMPWRMITAVDVAIIRVNSQIMSPFYCLYHLNSSYILNLVRVLATGTTRPRITRRNLSAVPIIIPLSELIEQFDENVSKIHKLLNTLREKNRILLETRNMLLPKLFSGEIPVNSQYIHRE